MTTLSAFKNFTDHLQEEETLMPVLFVGHGSPMNGIEDTEFSRRWTKMAKEIPVPKAVLVVSAHWFTKGTRITAMDFPPTIHDFGGFPQDDFSCCHTCNSAQHETDPRRQATLFHFGHGRSGRLNAP